MKIQVINKSKHALPEYATGQSAGMDIRANLDEPIVLKPLQRCLVPTGLYIALPEGFEAQIRPRSGLAIKKGIGVLNSPGTIDADYRGEICIILVNLSSEDFMIEESGAHCANGCSPSRTCRMAGSGGVGRNGTWCRWLWTYRKKVKGNNE